MHHTRTCGRRGATPQPDRTALHDPSTGEGIFGKLFGGGKPADSSGGSGAAAAPAQQQEAPEQRGTEFPPFQTVSKNDGYDLRFYEPYPVVEMDYRRRENGYLTLGARLGGAYWC